MSAKKKAKKRKIPSAKHENAVLRALSLYSRVLEENIRLKNPGK